MAKLQETAADSPAGRALPKGPDRKRYFLAVESVLQGLSDQGFENETRGVIHGDPTVRNIIVGRGAGRTAALVDFELAHVDALLSDLGYALYVNARPGPSATALSLDRFQAVVGGYHAVCPLDSRETRLVVLLTASRGLLVVARNLSQWQFVGPTLDRVDWVIRHRRNIDQRLQHQLAEAAL